MARLLPLLAWTVALLTASPTAAEAPTEEGAVVDRIEIRVDAPPGRPTDFTESLEIAVGEPADPSAVRRTLRNLFATGVVEGAEILLREETDGSLTAIVVVRTHTWVERVELVGDLGRPHRELERLVPQKSLTPLFENRVVRGVFALQDELSRWGYPDARVRLRVEPAADPHFSLASGAALLGGTQLDRATKRVVVRYEIEAGEPVLVESVRFEGTTGPFSQQQLIGRLSSRLGRPLDRSRLGEDAERLRTWLVRRDHLAARVDRPRLEIGSDGSGSLVVPLDVGRRMEVEVTGIDRRKIRKADPLLRGEPWEPSELRRLRTRIRDHLQEKGFWRAEVEVDVEESEERTRVAIRVEPGLRYHVEEVRIEGNEQLGEDELTARMTTGPRTPLIPGTGALVTKTLEEDLSNLRAYLTLQGYFEAHVGEPEVFVDGEGLSVLVPIEEGRRKRIVDLEIDGVESVDIAELRENLPIRPGEGFHPLVVDDTVNAIRAFYESRGYPRTAVAPTVTWNADETLADVHLRVEEGPRRQIDRIRIRGHQRTATEVVRNALPLEPGQVVSRLDLLRAEREVYRLGVFSRVEVDLLPSTELDERRDVLVRVDEGRRFRLAYGISYHSEDGLGGLFSANVTNLRGRGDLVQLDLRATGERERRFRLAYSQPLIGRIRLPLTFAFTQQQDSRESFEIDDRGVLVSVTRGRGFGFRLGLAAEYHLVEVSEEPTDPLDLEPEERDLRIASLTSTLLLDRRDDPLDAKRGWSTTLQAEVAAPVLAADAHFVKGFWQQTGILPLGALGRLVGSLRIGAIEPLDDTLERDPVVPEDLASGLVPISERFFAGGRSTHRAYERDRLGIDGETLIDRGDDDRVPIGGNGLLLANVDWRFPILGSLGGTVFVDAGNIWADWRDMDVAEVELGVGLGVRYLSPVGPIRFEVGWKLEPLDGARNPVFLLSVGNPF